MLACRSRSAVRDRYPALSLAWVENRWWPLPTLKTTCAGRNPQRTNFGRRFVGYSQTVRFYGQCQRPMDKTPE
jgi:hypothetical protein